jgi:hypothetical protein
MPLNDDPGSLTDDEYWDLVSRDAQPCPNGIPPLVLADALARLDDFDDYLNGEQ